MQHVFVGARDTAVITQSCERVRSGVGRETLAPSEIGEAGWPGGVPALRHAAAAWGLAPPPQAERLLLGPKCVKPLPRSATGNDRNPPPASTHPYFLRNV